MCGIIGFVSSECADDNQTLEVILAGLQHLEYRGYDSAGIAVIDNDPNPHLHLKKRPGRISNLIADLEKAPLPKTNIGIGHTRWATHGLPNQSNAHPHISNDNRLALIHNGIIENASSIRAYLENKGVLFHSNTDSEVAVHYLREKISELENDSGQDEANLAKAMGQVAKVFKGTFTLLAIDSAFPNIIVGAKHDSPLLVGLDEGKNFLASDIVAFIDHTNKVVEVGQDQIVTISANDIKITDFAGKTLEYSVQQINWDRQIASKSGYSTYMEKEIRQEPKTVADTLLDRIDYENKNLKLDEISIDITDFERWVKTIDKIIVLACGTAAYAGHVAKYAIEHWCRIPVEVELAHEFRYRDPIVNAKTLVISISQSGETMDTLMATKYAKDQGALTLAICNTQYSSIPKICDGVIYTRAGLEIAVASTKAFVGQITASYLLGLYIAVLRKNKFFDEIVQVIHQMKTIPDKIEHIIDQFDSIKQLATEIKDVKSVLFLGRHIGYPVALEGALKLKELAYIHAEGFAAGELKHGPIALIEQGQCVFVIMPSPDSPLHAKVLSNIAEIKSRGAVVFVVANENDKQVREVSSFVITRPICDYLFSALLDCIPLQIFALCLAQVKGLDVDQPRNLAKSVTVE